MPVAVIVTTDFVHEAHVLNMNSNFCLCGGNIIGIVESSIMVNGSVLIEYGGFQPIGSELETPNNTQTVDLSGKYVMLGLIVEADF